MSKRHKKSKLTLSEHDDDFGQMSDEDLYQAPKGKKPRGKEKRRQGKHKSAYYD